MPSTGIKIAIAGCAAVIIGLAAAFIVGVFFVKGKMKEKAAQIEQKEKQRTDLSKRYPFTPPAENVITEAQLIRFLAVRKKVYNVYQQHASEFRKAEGSGQGLSAAWKLTGLWNEMHEAQSNALEEQKMSPEEYQYLVTAVYKTWAVKTTKEAVHNETLGNAAEEKLKKSIAGLNRQIEDPNLNEGTREQLKKVRDGLQSELNDLSHNKPLQEIDTEMQSVPKENIQLFNRYKEEIQKYSMAGLEFLGL